MSHYPLPGPMRKIIRAITHKLEAEHNFDPFMGRKLYAYLYDQRYRDIRVNLMPHSLIYGNLQPSDLYNWTIKMKTASQKTNDLFLGYPGGKQGFFDDFIAFFKDPRRFSYNPLIIVKGLKPASTDDATKRS